MMKRISIRISRFLCRNNIAGKDKQELYVYALEILLSSLLHFFTTAIIGFLCGMLVESLIMYLAFSLVRRYAGGFHASTALKCYFTSIAAIIIMLFLISTVCKYGNDIAFYSILFISDVIIWLASPIESHNKPLTPKEKKVFKAVSIALSSFITASAVLIYEFVAVNLGVSLCFGLMLVATVLITSLLQSILSKARHSVANK